MKHRVIKAIVASIFLLMPQLILYLNERGNSSAVTVLCILHVLFYGYVVIILIGALVVYRPIGMAAISSKQNKRGEFLVLMIGSYHIAYALFVVGWGLVSIVLMATYAMMQMALIVGNRRLRKLSSKEQIELWQNIHDRFREYGPTSR